MFDKNAYHHLLTVNDHHHHLATWYNPNWNYTAIKVIVLTKEKLAKTKKTINKLFWFLFYFYNKLKRNMLIFIIWQNSYLTNYNSKW